MTLRRLIKLASKYGIYTGYKDSRRGWCNEWWHDGEVFVDFTSDEFVCASCENDEGEIDYYTLHRFSFYDYNRTWTIKRRKDVVKLYGNRAFLSNDVFYKETKRYKEEQKKFKKQTKRKLREYKKRKRQEKKNGRTK